MPAMTAAASARASVSGPRLATALDRSRLAGDATRSRGSRCPPASAQTIVDTHFGLMLETRASWGLVAQALTVLPTVVRSRNQREGEHRDGDEDQDGQV